MNSTFTQALEIPALADNTLSWAGIFDYGDPWWPTHEGKEELLEANLPAEDAWRARSVTMDQVPRWTPNVDTTKTWIDIYTEKATPERLISLGRCRQRKRDIKKSLPGCIMLLMYCGTSIQGKGAWMRERERDRKGGGKGSTEHDRSGGENGSRRRLVRRPKPPSTPPTQAQRDKAG